MICGLFGKSRQAHYKCKWNEDKLVLKHAIVIKTVDEIRLSMPRIGTRKLRFLLDTKSKTHDINIGRDKLFDLLDDYGLLIRKRRKRKAVTTDSSHSFKKYPNLIKGIDIIYPNQLWVSDITYINLATKFCYLSLITDAYSRKVVGFCLYPTLEKEGPLNALKMALNDYRKIDRRVLIHHSDRGLQYCCKDYIDMLKKRNVSISMTERGDPYENALAERMNGILKSEFLYKKSFRTFEEAADAVTTSITTYNNHRPHGSCDYLTPQEAHQRNGSLRKRWKERKQNLKHQERISIFDNPVNQMQD
jgi:putative transposase